MVSREARLASICFLMRDEGKPLDFSDERRELMEFL